MKLRHFSEFSQSTFQNMKFLGILVIICGIICFFVLNTNVNTLLKPQYGYRGDAISHIAPLKMLQEGFLMENPRLSSPFVFSFIEYPMDRLMYFLMLFLSKVFSLNIWGALNLYYLFTYFLSAIIAYIVLCKFRVSPLWSMTAAITYAFMPYHFARGVGHLALSSYYLVPVSFLIFSWLFEVKDFKLRYLWATIFYFISLSFQSTYYFFFAAIILGALFLRTIRIKDKDSTLTILTILVLSSLSFLVIYKLPAVLYQIDNGTNDVFIFRHFSDANVYALRLTSIVMPSSNPILPHNEAAISYIGIFGVFGLLCLFIPRRQEDSLNETMRYIFIVCFFFCTIDGLGFIFSYYTGGIIRGLNRVSVYLAFIAFFAAAKELDAYTRGRTKPFYLGIFACTCAIIFFDFFDYKDFLNRSEFHNPYALQYESDKEFFQKMENALPAGTQVYQLPYMPFPEVPPIHNMGDYEHFKAFIHTETLRFSYGANKGRQADYWNRYINSLTPEEMVKELETCGFGGLYLDTAGYQDKGVAFIEKLKDIIGREPTYSPDGRRLFFVLSPSEKLQYVQYPKYRLSSIVPLYAEKINYKYLELNWEWWGDDNGIWSAGRDVRLRFDVGEISSDIILRLEKTDIKLYPEERVVVLANGQKVASWGQEEFAHAILSAPIRQDIVNQNNGELEIIFIKENYSIFRDRTVRMKIKNIVLDPAGFDSAVGNDFLVSRFPSIDEGSILFGIDGNDSSFIVTGFSGPEGGFRWTQGEEAVIAFNLNMDYHDVVIVLDIFPLGVQHSEVFINGIKVEDWSIDKAEEKKLLLPKYLSENGNFIMSFKLPNAITPMELGINEDVRQLALGFRSIRFYPK